MSETTAALVMTDIEGSTKLWESNPGAMNAAMARHHEIVHELIARFGGWRPADQGEGDAIFAAFESTWDAVQAVAEFQQALAVEPWPAGIDLRDRVAVHAGAVINRNGNLFGSVVNRTARLRGLASGGQVLISAAAFELVRDTIPADWSVHDLGEHRMKDLTRPERVRQIAAPGMPTRFPALHGLDRAANNLPLQPTPIVGREREIGELRVLVAREPLVTITGFGGMGKTRLALQVAAELADGDGDGVWFIDLSAETDPARIATVVASALDIPEGSDRPVDALTAWLRERKLLLVLDNVEQLLPGAADFVAHLLASAPDVRIVVTSREPLRIRGERAWAIPPLAIPHAMPTQHRFTEAEVGRLSVVASVTLFIQRAEAARSEFVLTIENAAATAAICARLDGMPLALELAAARLRVLSPEALLPRLDHALRVLTGGNRDLPSRQQTLRATIAWSYDALPLEAQQLLDNLAVFPGSFTLESAERLMADGPFDVLEAITVLVDRSLLTLQPSAGETRYVLLVSIRDFAHERLDARGDTARATRFHASYYADLVTLARGWDRDAETRRDARVLADWHNVRAAIAALHDTDAFEAEVDLVAEVLRALSNAGRFGDATEVLEHAAGHLAGLPMRPGHVVLPMYQRIVASRQGRDEQARRGSEDVLRAARTLGDPSLLSYVLSLSAMYVLSRDESDAVLDEAEQMLVRATDQDALPRWRVEDRFVVGMTETPYLDAARSESLWRQRLPRLSGDDLARGQVNLAFALAAQGRMMDAAEALTAFESEEPPDYAANFSALVATHNVIGYRAATSDWHRVDRDLVVLERRLLVLDVPAIRLSAEFYRVEFERGTGDVAGARARLDDLSDRSKMEESQQARLHWIGAVLDREAGDIEGAARRLACAWAVELDPATQLDMIVLRALEAALQLLETDPRGAALLLGAALDRLPSAVLDTAVKYDVDGMAERLRLRLGTSAVDELFALGSTLPLRSTTSS